MALASHASSDASTLDRSASIGRSGWGLRGAARAQLRGSPAALRDPLEVSWNSANCLLADSWSYGQIVHEGTCVSATRKRDADSTRVGSFGSMNTLQSTAASDDNSFCGDLRHVARVVRASPAAASNLETSKIGITHGEVGLRHSDADGVLQASPSMVSHRRGSGAFGCVPQLPHGVTLAVQVESLSPEAAKVVVPTDQILSSPSRCSADICTLSLSSVSAASQSLADSPQALCNGGPLAELLAAAYSVDAEERQFAQPSLTTARSVCGEGADVAMADSFGVEECEAYVEGAVLQLTSDVAELQSRRHTRLHKDVMRRNLGMRRDIAFLRKEVGQRQHRLRLSAMRRRAVGDFCNTAIVGGVPCGNVQVHGITGYLAS